MPTTFSHMHLFRISNINQTEFMPCLKKMKKALKKQMLEKTVEQQIHQIKKSLAGMVK